MKYLLYSEGQTLILVNITYKSNKYPLETPVLVIVSRLVIANNDAKYIYDHILRISESIMKNNSFVTSRICLHTPMGFTNITSEYSSKPYTVKKETVVFKR